MFLVLFRVACVCAPPPPGRFQADRLVGNYTLFPWWRVRNWKSSTFKFDSNRSFWADPYPRYGCCKKKSSSISNNNMASIWPNWSSRQSLPLLLLFMDTAYGGLMNAFVKGYEVDCNMMCVCVTNHWCSDPQSTCWCFQRNDQLSLEVGKLREIAFLSSTLRY